MPQKTVAVIGGGPAGLMAAEVLAQGNADVHLYEAKPSVGRKFLVAGKGGLNLTHSEPFEPFLSRYGSRQSQIRPLLEAFSPDDVRAWCHGLDIDTFVGSSRRVFPEDMKAAPLLRRWVHRLRHAGVTFHVRHRWEGWGSDGLGSAGSLLFSTRGGARIDVAADAVVLALGGGSWPQLGSDGAWVPLLEERGFDVAPLQPSNCGFNVGETRAHPGVGNGGWSAHFRERFAGAPIKSVGLRFVDSQGVSFQRQGACVLTEAGIEGSLIYAASALIRDEISRRGSATIHLDLTPDRTLEELTARLSQPRGSRSTSTHLQRQANLKGAQTGLLRELAPDAFADPADLARAIKALPVRLSSARPIEEAISSAGGIGFGALDERLMVTAHPGLFCAGEMLDWEAPTGGYLLTACLASGRMAGKGALAWLEDQI